MLSKLLRTEFVFSLFIVELGVAYAEFVNTHLLSLVESLAAFEFEGDIGSFFFIPAIAKRAACASCHMVDRGFGI